jgi:GntR family transcriptional regulator
LTYTVLLYYYSVVALFLKVNPSSGLPVYLQIEEQIKHRVAAGALKPDDLLPSVRRLAAELGINPNTVARAYQELESDGLIRTVQGGGTFIAEGIPQLLKSERLRRLGPLAAQLAVEAHHLRLSEKEVLEMVQEEFEKLGARHDRYSHTH